MDLKQELNRARTETDSLFAAIDPSAIYERPISERHRMVFYLGHLEAFDWNQMAQSGVGLASLNPTFDKLFEFGIDPEPGQLPSDVPGDWPRVDEIERYRLQARESVDRHLGEIPLDVAHMMVEHRHMHAETFAYILHSLDYEKKKGPAPHLSPGESVQPEMMRIPAGGAVLGRDPSDGFGWDNEYAAHTVRVPEFSIGKYKVSNGEYLEFVKAGGPAPFYWAKREGGWFWRGMFGEVPLPLDWPVYVTLDQARAYASYCEAAIPSEAQYQRALAFAAGNGAGANLDYRYWDPVPIVKSHGLSQMVGNWWEWTSSVFAPFEGFTPRSTYPGYSANFFDGKHYVLKGASPRTAAKLVRPSLRNWFRAEYPYVYATFRLCLP
jgi:formylglycine-generating enzyme required for sulfatase activity